MELEPLIITRIFDAPAELIYEAWTNPVIKQKWDAPDGFVTTHMEIDARVGGRFLSCMQHPEYGEHWNGGEFLELTEFTRIVSREWFSNENGDILDAPDFGTGEVSPQQVTITIELKEVDGAKTEMTLTHSGLPHKNMELARHGWESAIDKIPSVLAEVQAEG